MPHYRLRNFTNNNGPPNYPKFPLAKMKKKKRGRIYIRNQYKKYVYQKQKALKMLQQQNSIPSFISEVKEKSQTAVVAPISHHTFVVDNGVDNLDFSFEVAPANPGIFSHREQKNLNMSCEVDSQLEGHYISPPSRQQRSSVKNNLLINRMLIPESTHRFSKVEGYLPCRIPINVKLSEKLCEGTKIRMFWPPDKTWSNGVVSFVYGTGMFTVDFEDDNEKGPLTYCLRYFNFKIKD